jgi:hypothetical protein
MDRWERSLSYGKGKEIMVYECYEYLVEMGASTWICSLPKSKEILRESRQILSFDFMKDEDVVVH